MARFWGFRGRQFGDFRPFGRTPGASSRCQQLGDTDQVVGGGCQRELPTDPFLAAMTGFAHRRGGLHPTEHLLDPFADDLARPVARMAGGTAVDALRRPDVFWATCGVTFILRNAATKLAAS